MSSKKEIIKLVVTRTLLVLFVAYVVLNTTKAMQKNYAINQQISALNTEITQLKSQLKSIENQLVYYQSSQYQHLEVKRRLGMKVKGEKVVLVPENTKNNNQAEFTAPILQTNNIIDKNYNLPQDQNRFFDQAYKNAKTWTDWLLRNDH